MTYKENKGGNAMIEKCPFCGNTNTNQYEFAVRTAKWNDGKAGYNVACSCGAMGPDADTREKVVERWNKRADKPEEENNE
jgi:Lar family restriction alleviation protein